MRTIEVMGNRADDSKGLGRLGEAIVSYPHGDDGLSVVAVDLPSEADMLVYCRKVDGTLSEAAEFCADTRTPLAFLSTGINTESIYKRNYPFIHVPNAALGVIDYLREVEEQARGQFAGWTPVITEHHQEAKADTSGTAKKLAAMLSIDPADIVSVRDFARSRREYEIPEESEDGYAVHSVTFINPETGEQSEPIEIVVRGRDVYAAGIIDIDKALRNSPESFPNGELDIVALVKSGVIKAASLR